VFRGRLATLMQRLADELGPAATIRRDGTNWTIQPARATASPLWIAGDNPWTLTVGFGHAGDRIELGYSSRTAADQELEELEAICRAVVAGRLVERRSGRDGSRWRLTLGMAASCTARPTGCRWPCRGSGSTRSTLLPIPIRPRSPSIRLTQSTDRTWRWPRQDLDALHQAVRRRRTPAVAGSLSNGTFAEPGQAEDRGTPGAG
jgi:hypothetical protein